MYKVGMLSIQKSLVWSNKYAASLYKRCRKRNHEVILMKKRMIFALFALCIIINGCSNRGSKELEEELYKKEQISQLVDEQREEMPGKIEVAEENENAQGNISDYQLTTPKKYTRVNHNNHIYVYDQNGNSLNISILSSKIEVDEYSEKNYHKLISSMYKNVRLQDLQHITIDKLKTLYLEYTGKKNDKNFINCRYYVEKGEHTVFIDLQARDTANCKILKSTVENMKF